MAQPKPPGPTIPPRSHNKDDYRSAIRTSINTGDLDESWGKALLKRANATVTQPTVAPSTSSPNSSKKNTPVKNNMDTDTSNPNQEQWVTPNNTVKPRKRQSTSPTTINNMYFSLSEIDSEPDNLSIHQDTRPLKKPKYSKPSNKNSPRNSNITGNNASKHQLNFNKINKSGFTATIEIWDTPIRDIIQALLKKELNYNDFVIRTKSQDRLIIIPSSPESLAKIKIALEDNPDWYTYTPQKEKPKNLILKKITDYNETE